MTDMAFNMYQVAQDYVKDFRATALKNAVPYIENGHTIVGFVRVDDPEAGELGVSLSFPEEIVEQNGSVLVFVTPINEPEEGYTTVKVPLDVILGKTK